MALRLQQALADFPITNLKHESVRSFVATLCSRFDLPGSDGAAPLRHQFGSLLSHVWQSNLGFWISDFVAIAAADPGISSADPEEAAMLSPAGVLAWVEEAAAGLHTRIVQMLGSGVAAPDQIVECSHATQSLLSVAQAVEAALGAGSLPAQQLTSSLQHLHETTQVLQWLEQLQQQRPGSTPVPLITRSSSFPSAAAAAAAPNHPSLAAWQQGLESRRQQLPGSRLFLQDLLDQLSVTSSTSVTYPSGYPFPDVLTAVQRLFLPSSSSSGSSSSSSSSSKARQARLAVLLYYLLDGGWLNSAAPFAQGFQLPLTLAQQWQCHHLLDLAHSSSSSSGPARAALDEASKLLGATACPDTPFRFVEVLLAAGRPATALAVQRARCAGITSGGGGGASSLAEALVLLRVQLGCGLLPEAFSELRRHCSRMLLPERTQHTQALIQELAVWATAPQQQDGSAAAAAGSATAGLSRLQAVSQLPLNCQEEAALLAWLRGRMAAGQSGGAMLPMFLLQRGRTLEAVSAYSDYCASPAGSAAVAAAAAATASGSGAAALHHQLHTLMAAAAASLPPSLRATATAAVASSGSRPVLQGLGFNPPAGTTALGSMPLVVLSEGAEPAVFASPLLPAAAGGLICSVARLAVADNALPAATPAAAAAAADARGIAEPAAAAGWAAAQQQPGVFNAVPSLFASEPVAAAAGGAAAAAAPAAASLFGGSQGGELPSLFDTTPAPKGSKTAAAGPDSGSFGGFGGFQGGADDDADLLFFSTPAVQVHQQEYGREVLGLASAHHEGPAGQAAAAAAAAARSSKRLRRTPERFGGGGGR